MNNKNKNTKIKPLKRANTDVLYLLVIAIIFGILIFIIKKLETGTFL